MWVFIFITTLCLIWNPTGSPGGLIVDKNIICTSFHVSLLSTFMMLYMSVSMVFGIKLSFE